MILEQLEDRNFAAGLDNSNMCVQLKNCESKNLYSGSPPLHHHLRWVHAGAHGSHHASLHAVWHCVSRDATWCGADKGGRIQTLGILCDHAAGAEPGAERT